MFTNGAADKSAYNAANDRSQYPYRPAHQPAEYSNGPAFCISDFPAFCTADKTTNSAAIYPAYTGSQHATHRPAFQRPNRTNFGRYIYRARDP